MFQTRTVARWRRRERPNPTAPWLPREQRVLSPSARQPLDCRLYLIYVLDPRTNYQTETLGYVGETSRWDPEIRLREHDGTFDPPGKPWADTITRFEVLPGVYGCKADVWAAEEAEVRRRQPLYNGEYNGDNPRRIWPDEQQRQRAERDAVRVVRGEITPEQTWQARWEAKQAAKAGAARPGRRWLPARARPAARPARWGGRLTARQRRQLTEASLNLVAWGSLTAFFWWLAARYTPILPALRLGALVGVLVAVGLVWSARPKRGRWRRAGNRLLRLLLLVVAVWLVWPALSAFIGIG